jgi:hypothetical protein
VRQPKNLKIKFVKILNMKYDDEKYYLGKDKPFVDMYWQTS